MKEINQLDLFSGIGGFHLGFERAGYKVNSYFSEVDKHAIAVYKNQFKDSTYVGSVTDVRGEDLPRIDLITFGSPCQDFSLAGKRKGMEGERSSLIKEAIRLIHECRPRVFVWENVKGTFSSNDGADFWAIIQAFTNIGGYRLEWQLLNTSWFLPQNRERIYLVGHLAEARRDWRGVFPLGGSNGEDNGKRIKVVGDRGTGGQQGLIYGDDGIAPCLNAHSFADPMKIKENFKEIGDYRSDEGWRPRKDNNCPTLAARAREDGSGQPLLKIIGYTRDAKGEVTDRHLKDTAGTIHTASGQGGNTDQFVKDVVTCRGGLQKNAAHFEEKSPALTSAMGMGGGHTPIVDQPNYRIRRLTPIECERLQGFPDNHTQYGNYEGGVKEMSNTQRYKQCGNAVTVDVVQAIAEKLHPLFEK